MNGKGYWACWALLSAGAALSAVPVDHAAPTPAQRAEAVRQLRQELAARAAEEGGRCVLRILMLQLPCDH